jgi:small neutral amino acid transporter SnatA (MarC family)
MHEAPAPTLGLFCICFLASWHSDGSLCMWLNGLCLVMEPSIMRGFKSWLDAWSTNSNTGLILHFFFIFPTFWWISMHVAQWIELSVGALGNKRVPKLVGCLKHQLQHRVHFAFFFCLFPTFWWVSMRVAQWIELSVGALGNEGVPKLVGCLKHQLHHWAHFAFFSFLPTFCWISMHMAQWIELSVGALSDEGVVKLVGCLKH